VELALAAIGLLLVPLAAPGRRVRFREESPS
jgi:hypothetical protein